MRLLLGELTSLSVVKLVFCTQEGRENVHTDVLFFDVSHTPSIPHHSDSPRSREISTNVGVESALRNML